MNIQFKAATTDQHFEGILALQQKNIYTSLSIAEQQQQGFVFAEHNMELLKTLAAELPQVVALANEKVVGYNLAMTASMKSIIPSIIPMFDAFERCTYQNKALTSYPYIVGGQVCVDQNFRGNGLLSKLYHATKDLVDKDYQLCVTEISTRNHLSLKIHQRMGFEVINTYQDDKELWNIVLWDFGK
ncbi:GNAT family N-acetyltransferase [Pedobacter sp. ASV12]|uniref:GNAT family N-acetyltransferase n=1 Tax=Pedobacter sp. ASV12 TaxID=2795120 RepID=UPI0018EA5429|nr:hypothetical protein [Pedobacter sp. ASV12]